MMGRPDNPGCVDCVVYERRTGRIHAVLSVTHPEAQCTPELGVLAPATADLLTQRVDLSSQPPRVVDLPPRPSELHEFDHVNLIWRLDRQKAAGMQRFRRDRLLAECDWTQLPDVPDATKTKWQRYRQALRDITAQPGFPERIEWPTPP